MCDTLAEIDPHMMSSNTATVDEAEPTISTQACLDTIGLAQSIMSEMDALALSHSLLRLPNFLEPLSPELEPSPIDESSSPGIFLATMPSKSMCQADDPQSNSSGQSNDDHFDDDVQVQPFKTNSTSHVDRIEPICFETGHISQGKGSDHISNYLLDDIGKILVSDSSCDQSNASSITNETSPVAEYHAHAYTEEPNLPQKLEPTASNESSVAQVGQRKTRRWEEQFDELGCFKFENGHCNVTAQNSQQFPKLLQWIKRQRYHFKSQFCAGLPGVLTEERVMRMESLGFVWNTHCEKWENNFAKLELYTRQHGHCNVPRNSLQHARLSRWVKRQRRCYVTKSLEIERIERLESIGFVWDIRAFLANERRSR